LLATRFAIVTIHSSHLVCNGYNNHWPPSLQLLKYILATQSAIGTINVVIDASQPICNGCNNHWPPSSHLLQYILATWSAMVTIYFGQSIYSGLNAELVLSGHSIHGGDCPMFGHSVGFRAPAGIGWPDRNGVLSSRVGGSRWGNPLKGLNYASIMANSCN